MFISYDPEEMLETATEYARRIENKEAACKLFVAFSKEYHRFTECMNTRTKAEQDCYATSPLRLNRIYKLQQKILAANTCIETQAMLVNTCIDALWKASDSSS